MTRLVKSRSTIGEITWAIEGQKALLWHISLRFLSGSSYQRAYVDFFEDELVLNGYHWRKVLAEYLFTGKEPLINCVIAGCTVRV